MFRRAATGARDNHFNWSPTTMKTHSWINAGLHVIKLAINFLLTRFGRQAAAYSGGGWPPDGPAYSRNYPSTSSSINDGAISLNFLKDCITGAEWMGRNGSRA